MRSRLIFLASVLLPKSTFTFKKFGHETCFPQFHPLKALSPHSNRKITKVFTHDCAAPSKLIYHVQYVGKGKLMHLMLV